jgi:kynurenine formamidase
MTMGTGDGVLGDGHARIQASDDMVVLALQASTQLDGLAHVGADHALYNGYWGGLVTSRSRARRVGMHHQADGIVGRGVLLDVARYAQQDPLPGGFAIGPDELDATAAAQGTALHPGDAVLVRTGWLGATMAAGGTPQEGAEPGLSAKAVPWLHAHDIALVATDTMTCEVRPADEGTHLMDFHIGAIRDLGLQVCELYDLDALAEHCAADGVYEFFFACMPLPVVNGVGSPINPLAVK